MSTQHTPGPWSVAEKENRDDLDLPYWCVFSLSDAETAPSRAYGDTPEQRKANAGLIAAAPDLLAALDRIKDYVMGDPVAASALTQARAAIAKAQGGAS